MLSLVMLTKNSGSRIATVLSQARMYADKLYILVDSESDDDTEEVCRKYADYVEVVDTPGYIEPLLPYLYDLPDTEWIIRLDSDELVGDRFINDVDGLMDGRADAWWLPRYSMVNEFEYLCDRPMYPDYQLRMFKKGSITPRTDIHLTPHIHGAVGDTNLHIFHMKYLWKGRGEREELAKHYDEISLGAGSAADYAPHQLPEKYYRGGTAFVDEWVVDPHELVLNLGCGKKPRRGTINVDSVNLYAYYPELFDDREFVQWDLNEFPYPWGNGSVSKIIMSDVLEHLKADSLDIFNELWRILKPGGVVRIRCPSAHQPGVFQDMTHVKFLIKDSFWHLDPEHLYGQEFYHYTPYKWKVIRAEDIGNTGAFTVWMQKRLDAKARE